MSPFWPIVSVFFGILAAIVGFFFKRYVDQNDKNIAEAFAQNKETLQKVSKVSDELARVSASFQGLLSSEKRALADEMATAVSEAKIVRGLFTESKKEVSQIKTSLDEISVSTKKQSEIVANLVKLGLKNDKEIKTLIEQIGADAFIVKQKK